MYYGDSYLYPSGGVSVSAPYFNLSIQRRTVVQPSSAEVLPSPLDMPPAAPDSTTYPYDGGPRKTVPMPSADPPAVPLPIDTKPATPPLKVAGKIVYPAYGEQTTPANSLSADPTFLVKTQLGKNENK